MLEFASKYPKAMEALPLVERERVKLPREYVATIIYTMVGEPFKQWMDKIVNERHEKRREHLDQIAMDPIIAQAFQQSTAVSVSKGISHNLMKQGGQKKENQAGDTEPEA